MRARCVVRLAFFAFDQVLRQPKRLIRQPSYRRESAFAGYVARLRSAVFSARPSTNTRCGTAAKVRIAILITDQYPSELLLCVARRYSRSRRSRSAFAITVTELNVIAALAIIGLRSNPKNG